MQLARNIIAMAKNSSGRLTKKYNQQVRHWRAIKCLMSSPTPPQVPFDKKKSGALLRALTIPDLDILIYSRDVVAVAALDGKRGGSSAAIIYFLFLSLDRSVV
jgi:hypothetical protein